MASYPTFDNRWFNVRDQHGEVRPAVPADRRPRQVDPRQPRGAGPVQHRLVDQAVHRLVGDPRRAHHARRRLPRPGHYKLTSIDEATCCASGVRCEFKNADDPYGTPSQLRPGRRRGRAGGQLRRVLLPARRGVLHRLPGKRDELKADLEQFGFGADTGIQLPFECDGRIPDDAVKKDLSSAACSARTRPPSSSSATTCRSPSARACWRRRRCSWPTRTRRSPTAASSCSRTSSRPSTRR